MKLNSLKANLNSRIINKVRSLPNIHLNKNNSEISLNNISSTTNASVIKNTQNNSVLIQQYTKKYRILKKIKLNNDNPNIKLNKNDLFYSTKNKNKKTLEILKNADNIIRDRTKFHELLFNERKYLVKSLVLKKSREISYKSYENNILKKRRIQIYDKEYEINKALKEYKEQLEKDYINFNKFVGKVKNNHISDEDSIYKLKDIKEKKEDSFEKEILLNKRLLIMIEKTIKDIYILKEYGSFLYKIIQKPFAYDAAPKISSSIKNYETIADSIINIYESKDQYNFLPKELLNEDLLLKKYKILEYTVISDLEYKENLDKELEKDIIFYKNEIEQIKLSIIDYENDLNYLKKELNIIKKDIKKYKLNEDNGYLKDCIYNIIELGKEINPKDEISKITDKNVSLDFLNYIKEIKESLLNMEIKINNNIMEIENILENGDKNDRQIIMDLISEQKKMNKYQYNIAFKKLKEEMKNKRDLKIYEKANKYVLKGRKIILDFPIKLKNKNKKIIKRKNNEENFEIQYSDTEEDKK